MIIRPLRNQMMGRCGEITRTAGGMELPTSKMNTTVFVVIDAIGPDVKNFKEGDIVIPKLVNHIYLRDGFHRVLLEEETTLAKVDDLPIERLTIPGS